MEVVVKDCKSQMIITTLKHLSSQSTILELKKSFAKQGKKVPLSRLCFRLEPRGRSLKDEETLHSLRISSGAELFFKDLGPQISWKGVFLLEYAGPLFIYLAIYYFKPRFLYGPAHDDPRFLVVHIAAACWSFHYAKRLLETLFVHRFSYATMPIANLFKNCGYYWGFAAIIAYFINHPFYTNPTFAWQINLGFFGMMLNEFGNLSIHVALRNLRPAGTKQRKIPVPTWNPFTLLFTFVSCPNYTYEVGAWLCFTVMTQCAAAAIFTIAGFVQMTIWALGKHRNYRKEFQNYPRSRKSIVPFVI